MSYTDNIAILDVSITSSWEDDGARVQVDRGLEDLNSMLAKEQTSIMNAEAALTVGGYEFHRNASRDARRAVNKTAYPEHQSHLFANERLASTAVLDEALKALIERVKGNEQQLVRQVVEGNLNKRSLQSRSRFLRQDKARVGRMSRQLLSETALGPSPVISQPGNG